MKEILEALAAAQGWIFDYGRADYHNLFNGIDNKGVTHVFLDPVERSKKRDDNGTVESLTYSGSFMMLYSSDIDEEGYNKRYLDYIKPIIDSQVEIVETELICNQEATIEEWKELEVINLFDQNLDGIVITYRISIDQ